MKTQALLWQGIAAVGMLALGSVARAQRPSDMPVTNDRPGAGSIMGDHPVGGDQEPLPGATKAANPTEDAAVVAKVHHINMMEVDAGKLARDKGNAKRVREFGARLV